MATSGKIDPAFQAAPVLQGVYNPVEFAQRLKTEKFQEAKLRQEQISKRTEEGLKNLMIDLKGWEDQEGFKELMADQDKIVNGFVELSRKGMNLISPRTTEEVMAYKAITDAHERVKQKADIWNQQKAVYDLLQKGLEEDNKLDSNQQRIDHAQTEKNLQELLKNKSILKRGDALKNVLVAKPSIEDVHKYVRDNLPLITKPPKIQVPYTDPETGLQASELRDGVMTPALQKQQIADLRNLYRTANAGVKAGVKSAKSQDETDANILSDEDYFVQMYNPKFKETIINKISGGGGGFMIDFGGQKQKMQPGVLAPQPKEIGSRIYSGVYEFPATTKPSIINLLSNEAEEHTGRGDAKTGSDGWKPVRPDDAGNVEANLIFYDPKRDELVFRTTQNNDKPYIRNNTEISVKRTSVTGSDDLPIIVDGKPKKLKDVIGEKKTGVRLIGGKDFSK
jgi:hypothetical protein